MKPKPSRKREIIKIRTEINDIETKKTIEQINSSEQKLVLWKDQQNWGASVA